MFLYSNAFLDKKGTKKLNLWQGRGGERERERAPMERERERERMSQERGKERHRGRESIPRNCVEKRLMDNVRESVK